MKAEQPWAASWEAYLHQSNIWHRQEGRGGIVVIGRRELEGGGGMEDLVRIISSIYKKKT